MHTLMIKDLSASVELDRAAMSAVLGGEGNQANGTSQSNVQAMAAAANIGNGSLILGPATIQSDNTFTQDAHNTSYSTNVDLAALGVVFPFGLR
jgi:hypothetical protein